MKRILKNELFMMFKTVLSMGLFVSTVGVAADQPWRYEEAVKSTQSFKFKWLEVASPEREGWVREQNRSTNTWLNSLRDRKAIEKWVRTTVDYERNYSSAELKDGSKIYLRANGLGKSVDIVWKSKTSSGFREAVIYRNTAIDKNHATYFQTLAVSSDEKYLAVKALRHGSIDQANLLIFELAKPSGALLKGKIPSRYNASYAWSLRKGIPHIFISTGVRDGVSVYNVKRLEQPVEKLNADGVSATDGWLVLSQSVVGGATYSTQLVDPSGKRYSFPEPIEDFIGVSDGKIYYSPTSGARGEGKYRIKIAVLNGVTSTFDCQSWSEVPGLFMASSVSLKKLSDGRGQVTGLGYWGKDRKAFAIDTAVPNSVSVFVAPPYADFMSIDLSKDPAKLPSKVLLSSYLKRGVEFQYDSTTQSYSPDPAALLISASGKQLVSRVSRVKSFDGTEVDMRMTYFDGIKPDSNNPVYFEVYGGFRNPSGFYPFFIGQNDLRLKFLEKGGIMVGGTVRGGNEYGDAWNAAARYENKTKTFEDVASIAKNLIDEKWTSAKKIALTGGSNGGMVVAATGMLFPDYFGLIIPRVGVHDMIGKDDLDLDFVNGWTYEYLSGKNEFGFKTLLNQSPLELSLRGVWPNFLVSGARNDTRVHPSHSMKLAAAMKENTKAQSGYVRFFAVNYTGHFFYSTVYQDLIAWRSNVIHWSALFEQFGWSLE